ncbi:MAG: hypothetical protein ACKOCE_08435 [Acidimicrobiia bacterium]
MGLFSVYLAYRHGKKKAERRARRDDRAAADERDHFDDEDDECDECGHPLSKHSDDDPPLCPNY